MAEEVHNPAEILPKAITWSIPIGTLSGVVFLLPILFTLPDVATLLQGQFNPEYLVVLLIYVYCQSPLASRLV